MHGGACRRALVLTLALGAGCGFDTSGAGGPGGGGGEDGGGGGTIDAGGGGAIDAGGGGDVDADVVVSTFCQGGGSLEACYELDGNLEDSSQNNNDLTGTNVTFSTGMRGQALVATQSSKMSAIKTATLDFVDELTMEVYVMPSQVHNRWAIDHEGQWGIALDEDRIICSVVVLEGDDLTPTEHSVRSDGGTIAEDEWTHVACTYDGATLVLYLDGVVATAPELVSGPIATAPNEGFTVGRDVPDGSSWLGRLDSVRIWSVARTEQQILGSL